MSNLTPNTWLLILFALVPGFVANRVFALWCPTQKQDWEKALLEPITWSAINLLFWWWLVLPILQTPFETINGWRLSWVTALVCAVSPTILASVWYRFRKSEWAHQTLRLDHPTPRGWDFFLHRCRNCFVLIHMKDGRMVGGYYGPVSYASTYPQEPEIHLEQVWKIDQTTGVFEFPIEGSLGTVVRQADWDRIEFFEVPPQPEASEHGRQTQECNERDAGQAQCWRAGNAETSNGNRQADRGTEGRNGDTPKAANEQELGPKGSVGTPPKDQTKR